MDRRSLASSRCSVHVPRMGLVASAAVVVCLWVPAAGTAAAAPSIPDTSRVAQEPVDTPATPPVSALLPPVAPATERPYYFYRALPYGSESLVHPLRIIINGGFGITSFDNRDNRLDAVDYETGVDNVWMNLSNPIRAIEENGWRDFFEREVLPLSVSTKKAHYWPNYTLHVVGGGMSYRLAEEWFRYHGYPYSKTLSVATMAAYHLVNEVVENDDFVGWSTDAVADIYVFDPLGIILFSFDPVARFFSETLNMAEWSYQAAYDPKHHALENHGQNFVLKYDLGDTWSVFYHLGTHGELGFSYRQDDGDAFSFGFGGQAKDIFAFGDGVRSLDLAPSAGFFWDRNNSLLASLILSRREDAQMRLNVYPGVFGVRGFSPGFIFALDRDGGVQLGISFDAAPFFPLGLLSRF